MLTSITPLGERGRGGSWRVTAGWFAVGAVIGGASIGAVFGGLGWLAIRQTPLAPYAVAVAVCALVGAALETGAVPLHIPSSKRQVSDLWLYKYRGWVYGLGFGFQLGLGVVTVVNTYLTYVMLLACALTRSPALGAIIGGLGGATRALPLLQVRAVWSFGHLVQIDRRQDRWERTSERFGLGLLLVVGATLVVPVVGGW